ncbi:hypothetical protein AGLY_018020 [Aphis glycines]|uniref:MULE transposase domain-containing protein n=2 Tax=Aphis glycines TaxID=307491 RepID=A0A6G0ST69_APHGL|nr:hypothetical protein AGLY_018020 [Aphis glycines]
MNVISVISEKGKTILICDGFKFGFQKNLANDVKRWTCTKKICSAYLKINMCNEIQFENSKLIHNCAKDSEQKINRQILSNNLKRKALEQLSERPAKLFHDEMKKCNVSTLTSSDVTYIKNNMNHARNSIHPKLLQDANEIHNILSSIEIKTFKGENFLMVNDPLNGFVMFSCDENIIFLSSLTTIYVDGTFDYCVQYFCQLFTIHGFKNNYYIPLAFFLLRDKSQVSYKRAFVELQNQCLKSVEVFEPKMCFVDFEKSIHNALLEVWPQIEIKGCIFHLCQSWWRKIQKIGLATEYSKNDEIGKYLTYIFGFPFLHPEEVGDVFAIDLGELKPENDKLTEFSDYLVDNYIDEDSSFPPKIWAEMTSSAQRSTNACESFHSKYNSNFSSTHPHIYKFLDVLKAMQLDTVILINSSKMETKIIRTATKNKNKFINNLIDKLNMNEISKLQYLKALANKFKPRN